MGRRREFDPEQALEAAMNVFWASGYRNTSIDDLLAAMKINRFSMYQTFGDKSQLFTKALSLYRERWSAFIASYLKQGASPRASLMALFRAQGKQVISDKLGRGCLMANSAFEISHLPEDAATMVRESIDRLEATLTQTITRAQASGEIDPRKDALSLARFLIFSMNGIRGAAKLEPDRAKLTELVEIMLSAVH
jgi:TetR/AcrR family transcriptional repressor of nem operon